MQSRSLLALLACAGLCSCGGGGGGVNSTPLPPAPPPPPPPPPVSPNYQLAANRDVDQRFSGIGIEMSYSRSSSSGEISGYAQNTANVTVEYSATTKSYTVTFAGERARFGPDDLVFQNDEGASYDNGEVYFTAVAFTDTRLRYLQFGGWSSSETGDGNLSIVWRRFIFGSTTVDSDMPKSGTADFYGSFFGSGMAPSGRIGWHGEGTLTVDFGSGSLLGQIPLHGSGDLSSPVYEFQLQFNGSFGAGVNDITGTVSSSAYGLTGTFEGQFFGPRARELGLTTEFSNGAVSGIGVFAGIDLAK